MPSIGRRRVLQLSGLSLVGMAGCSALSDRETAPRLEELSIQSFDDEAHTVNVALQDGEEDVYRRSVDIPAAEPTDSTGAILEGYPGSPVRTSSTLGETTRPEERHSRSISRTTTRSAYS